MVADIFAKQWSIGGSILYWSLELLGYIVANIFWLFSIREGSGLARGATIFSITTEVLAVIIGLYLFKEQISRIQFVGICVSVLSLILILWPEPQATFFK